MQMETAVYINEKDAVSSVAFQVQDRDKPGDHIHTIVIGTQHEKTTRLVFFSDEAFQHFAAMVAARAGTVRDATRAQHEEAA